MNTTCDVLIVGAGVAGVPAAVAAARAGADTLLLEKHPFPGGAGGIAGHRSICGLYWNRARTEAPGRLLPGPLLNGGLVREICERLQDMAPGHRPFRLGKVDILPFSPDHFKRVYTQLIQAEPRLRVMFNGEVKAVGFERDCVSSVGVGDLSIVPRVVVDCSGDGVIIRCRPDLHEPPPEGACQLAGYVIRFSGLEGEDDMLPIKIPYALRQGVDSRRIPAVLRFTTFVSGEDRDEGGCKMSVPAGTPLTQAREWARQLHEYLKAELPQMRASRIVHESPEVLEREGARLKGQYTLTAGDILEAREFPDAVVRSAWPMELWDPKLGPTYRYPEPGKACGIPIRCLKAAAMRNLYCAGRCISVTHEALAATRVMGPCMALGEAAGIAAAMDGCRLGRATSG